MNFSNQGQMADALLKELLEVIHKYDESTYMVSVLGVLRLVEVQLALEALQDDEIYDAAYSAYCRGENTRELFRIMWNSRLTCSIGWDRDELKSFARNIAAIYIHSREKNNDSATP